MIHSCGICYLPSSDNLTKDFELAIVGPGTLLLFNRAREISRATLHIVFDHFECTVSLRQACMRGDVALG